MESSAVKEGMIWNWNVYNRARIYGYQEIYTTDNEIFEASVLWE